MARGYSTIRVAIWMTFTIGCQFGLARIEIVLALNCALSVLENITTMGSPKMDFQTFPIFMITRVVVISSPMPTANLMASQRAGHGLKPTLYGALGITCAKMIFYALPATVIASLAIAFYTAFQIIKWMGLAYLIYLGCFAILPQFLKVGRANSMQFSIM